MWLFYNIVFPVIFLLMTPHFLFRMWKRGGYGTGFMQRFGIYGKDIRARLKSRRRIWIHAVSVGEIVIALRFIEELRRLRPGEAFVITTATSTGRTVAKQRIAGDDILLYFPVDLPFIMKRVLGCLKPRALVLVESELWPNLIRIAGARTIPLVLLNARLSEKSYRGYMKMRPWVRDILRRFDLLCVQDEINSRRLKELGADPGNIRVVGSAKYDTVKSDRESLRREGSVLLERAFGSGYGTLLGGSTWPGEESVLLDVYKGLRRQYDDVKLVLVPRHAERADEVLMQVKKSGLTAVRRTEFDSRQQPGANKSPDVLLVDTTGELNTFYAVATVIFVGKSLVGHGGQNIIEPAVFAKPVIIGPHMENFSSVTADFLAAQAVVQVQDAQELRKRVIELWGSMEEQTAYGERAKQLVLEKSGALRASVEEVIPLLEKSV